MKILAIHSDYLEYEAKKKALKQVEEPEKKKERIEECLVVFQGSEKTDEKNPDSVAEKTVEEIKDIAEKVNAVKIVLYPFVHLTENPSSPKTAQEILKKEEEILKDTDLEIHTSPFGWYKAFEVKCKGHPLAELSRKINPGEEKKPVKERGEEEEFFKFIIIDKQGNEHEVTKENWQDTEILNKEGREYESIKNFVRNEIGNPEEKKQPPHIELMKRHDLVDYCDVADAGHFKWHPKGVLIKELILSYQDELAKEYGAFKIQNPLVYRLDKPQINKLVGEFGEKIYRWEEGDREFLLRPASDPGAFPYAHNLSFSYKQMPLKEYEEALCFRKEQRGELSGLKRVRNFLMTDLHTLTKNEERAQEEFEELCFICKDLMNSLVSKDTWVMGWEGTQEYWEENKEWIKQVNKDMETLGFVKLMKERSHYYSMKNEYQAVHPDGSSTQISTVQMDVVNGERFDITYTAEDNEEHPCTILHCSTFGSIERALASILEDSERHEDPTLPIWLSPTQVRVIPVSEGSLEYAEQVADKIGAEDIRVDIDDESESVGKRIRKAEKEWVPVTLVVGPEEKKSGVFKPRIRGKEEKKMSIEEIQNYIHRETAGYPYKPISLPRKLSKRPKFS